MPSLSHKSSDTLCYFSAPITLSKLWEAGDQPPEGEHKDTYRKTHGLGSHHNNQSVKVLITKESARKYPIVN
jgi:hypothetical protein